MFRIHSVLLAATVSSFAFVPGCGQQGSSTDNAVPATWLLNTPPEQDVSVTDAKASSKEGDPIVLRGIIGGSAQPLTDDSAVFRIVDTGLFNRCTAEAEHCPTPWDYCCATPEDVMANSATIQIVNADGTPIEGSPKSGGLTPLDEVIVVGTVAPRPSDAVLTVRATGVYRAN